jgi:hypothetical protein
MSDLTATGWRFRNPGCVPAVLEHLRENSLKALANQMEGNRIVTGLLVLAGVGAMGVGIFSENFSAMHEIVSDFAFFFGGLLPIAGCMVLRKPLSYLSVVTGVLSLCALALLSAQYSFGLGQQYSAMLSPPFGGDAGQRAATRIPSRLRGLLLARPVRCLSLDVEALTSRGSTRVE